MYCNIITFQIIHHLSQLFHLQQIDRLSLYYINLLLLTTNYSILQWFLPSNTVKQLLHLIKLYRRILDKIKVNDTRKYSTRIFILHSSATFCTIHYAKVEVNTFMVTAEHFNVRLYYFSSFKLLLINLLVKNFITNSKEIPTIKNNSFLLNNSLNNIVFHWWYTLHTTRYRDYFWEKLSQLFENSLWILRKNIFVKFMKIL